VKSSAPLRRQPPALIFRDAIERAEADGVARKAMTLRLTRGDANLLKRDPNVAVADISFAEEGMRFLGVIVQQEGVAVSELLLGAKA
jgi:hypothetical protein